MLKIVSLVTCLTLPILFPTSQRVDWLVEETKRYHRRGVNPLRSKLQLKDKDVAANVDKQIKKVLHPMWFSKSQQSQLP